MARSRSRCSGSRANAWSMASGILGTSRAEFPSSAPGAPDPRAAPRNGDSFPRRPGPGRDRRGPRPPGGAGRHPRPHPPRTSRPDAARRAGRRPRAWRDSRATTPASSWPPPETRSARGPRAPPRTAAPAPGRGPLAHQRREKAAILLGESPVVLEPELERADGAPAGHEGQRRRASRAFRPARPARDTGCAARPRTRGIPSPRPARRARADHLPPKRVPRRRSPSMCTTSRVSPSLRRRAMAPPRACTASVAWRTMMRATSVGLSTGPSDRFNA